MSCFKDCSHTVSLSRSSPRYSMQRRPAWRRRSCRQTQCLWSGLDVCRVDIRQITHNRAHGREKVAPFDRLISRLNLQLYSITFFVLDIQLDRIASLVLLGIYCCWGTSSLLSNFTNPRLKEFRIEHGCRNTSNEDIRAQFSFIRRFQD